MENQALQKKEEEALSTKSLFQKDHIQKRFNQLLGKKSQGFISSVLQIVNNSKLLTNADPNTVLTAAVTAATLDLPINPNLGFSWIVPYKGQAQFQMGWKGYVQLALRTGQYSRINVTEVYENQFKSFNRLTEELVADFNIEGKGDIVGYAAYFKLINGLEKLSYWSKEEVINHAKKYSQAYGKGSFSPWNDKEQFHAMAKKTVLKNTISKWGIMSIELQTAQLADQAVQPKEGEYNYVDNIIDIEAENIQEEQQRIVEFINNAQNIEQLQEAEPFIEENSEAKELYNKKLKDLTK
ncbi:hypothetical protein D1Z97_03120 [Riemerella anatipestifer]|uniref:recombinase RecT n=1 Tax=Riemerella anatipestifer TaxID=34085 RepID=UPI00129D6EF0|nr:recombinase RecT [Riemerella anatipestifer]MRN00199.1 hypothetical protein [Riemerella anatipestifer]MRN02083.1 hypothetical protein [Riemerella anatipestifer]